MSVRTVNKCSNQMFEVSPFYAVDHDTDSLLICFDQNDATLQSVILSDCRRHGSGSGRLVPAECPKSHSPPDWDLAVWWPIQWADEVGCLSWQQRNCLTGTVGWGTLLLEGEEVTDDVSKDGSFIGNWDLWQQFERIENLINGVRDSSKTWRRWQK